MDLQAIGTSKKCIFEPDKIAPSRRTSAADSCADPEYKLRMFGCRYGQQHGQRIIIACTADGLLEKSDSLSWSL